tara:strand:+ start:686 stop:967 length:282 start_codon:yes stop_codon:yes gene_type:complete
MDKIQNNKDLAYYNNFNLVVIIINKLIKHDIDNEDYKEIQKGLIDVAFYVNNLQTHYANSKIAVSAYREERNDALLTIEELKEEIEWNEKHEL